MFYILILTQINLFRLMSIASKRKTECKKKWATVTKAWDALLARYNEDTVVNSSKKRTKSLETRSKVVSKGKMAPTSEDLVGDCSHLVDEVLKAIQYCVDGEFNDTAVLDGYKLAKGEHLIKVIFIYIDI